VVAEEGVPFNGGVADPQRRLNETDLRALL
jgi:hypothetical protein